TAVALVDRYPGAQPFSDTPLDHLRFFGRDEETSLLLHQLLRVDFLVLFALPGLGKTSLLNAKLFPLLRERDLLPLPVRFNHTERSLTPLQVFTAAIEQACKAETIDYTPGATDSLWEFFKTAIFWRCDRLQTPVLILDQFEEIFTLQGEDFRHTAAAELGQLLGRRLPGRVRQQIQEGQPLPFSETPPEVKVLLSLREDDLGMLQEITPEIPTILQNRFRLTGLSSEDARQAITGPAGRVVEDVQFSTRPFEYNETTVDEMIATARNREGSIDPFLLQLRNRSGCENRNHAAACDFWALLGSRDGAASPRKAASCAAVRYSKTLRCCCFNVATTVIMFATKREPSSLCVPKLPVRHSTPGRSALSAVLFVGSTPSTCPKVHHA